MLLLWDNLQRKGSKTYGFIIPMGDIFISFPEGLTSGQRCRRMTAFLKPHAVSLAWWYIGSCLSAVCVSGCRTVVECSLLTSVIISVSLCEPVAGNTQQALYCQHVKQRKRQNL